VPAQPAGARTPPPFAQIPNSTSPNRAALAYIRASLWLTSLWAWLLSAFLITSLALGYDYSSTVGFAAFVGATLTASLLLGALSRVAWNRMSATRARTTLGRSWIVPLASFILVAVAIAMVAITGP
jgi:hypothetical protein